MKKRAKRMLIGTGITAAMMALAESARHGAADYFVGVALNRKIPPHPMQAEKRLVIRCADSAMLEQIARAGKAFASCPHETVELEARDGTCLVGHWMPVRHPRRIILAMHGWRSVWHRDFAMIADFFSQNGCSVLYAEQRAQGSSGGEYIGFGLTERYDCLDWIDWINKKTGNPLPVYLCGISMGASTVLMAAGLELPENVQGILADCGYTSPTDIWNYVAGQAHISYGICKKPVSRLAKKRLRVAIDEDTCPRALSRSKTPVLFIHGTDDKFVPVQMTYENYKACAAPKRLFIVPGAEHGMSYLVDPRGYENAVKAFWEDFDDNISP